MQPDPERITPAGMAANIRHVVNFFFTGIADPPRGPAFELTVPATGQRFRVTVTEVAAWSWQMEQELAEVTSDGAA